MPQDSTTSSPPEGMYESKIITGAHGDRYQKDLALAIFNRATMEGYDFQLGYEMEMADKFDDVAFFNKTTVEWTLIQVKHAEGSKGKSPLTFETLFPTKDGDREKGDFSLYKYLKSYMTVQSRFKERKNIIIFTNRTFLTNEHKKSASVGENSDDNIQEASQQKSINFEKLSEIEDRLVDKIFFIDGVSCFRLTVDEKLIDEMIQYINQDFNELKNGIINLFGAGIVDKAIEKFKVPVASMLTKTKTIVKFSDELSAEALQFLEGVIDVQSAQRVIDDSQDSKKIRALFTGGSRITTLPSSVDKETVRNFFQNLVLSTNQPDNLRNIIDNDLRSWMRTWVRPDYFQRLGNLHVENLTGNLEKIFDERRSHAEEDNIKSNYKNFLELKHGKEFFRNTEEQIKIQANLNNANEFYINRRIRYMDHTDKISVCGDSDFNMQIFDDQFVDEIIVDDNKQPVVKNQQFILLTAEPGMGKSTTLEFVALKAQQKSNYNVYLFYLNKFNQELEKVNENDSLDKHFAVLKTMLSEQSFMNLKEDLNLKEVTNFKEKLNPKPQINDEEKQYFVVFDALDEVFPKNRKKVLKIFSLMLEKSNIKIIVSARRPIEALVEDCEEHFKVNTINLIPFSDQDQMSFLNRFWKVSADNNSRFRKYKDYLFNFFRRDINRVLCEFTGLPLMLKMLAEVYEDNFNEYLRTGQINLDKLMPKNMFSTSNLYERFIIKCLNNKLKKKSIHLDEHHDEEFDWIFKNFTLEHQLLAIKHLQIEDLQNILEYEEYAVPLSQFEARIKNGSEKSPLVEAVNNDSRFVHLSYAEFLVARFLLLNMTKSEAQIFETDSGRNLFERYPMIRIFFFAMIEEQYTHNMNNKTQEYLEILETHYKTNSNIALWACEVNGQKTVEFLLSTSYDTTIINRLLSVATEHSCYNICTYLLSKLNCKDNEWFRSTPLESAAESDQGHVAKLLIQHSSNVNARDHEGRTPLHNASQNRHMDVIKVLVDNFGNVNAKDADGKTPLHFAAQCGHNDVINLLNGHSADKNAKDNDGQTPLDFAIQYNYMDSINILTDSNTDLINTLSHLTLS